VSAPGETQGLVSPEPFDEAHAIFAAHGLVAGRLMPAAGMANRVLMSATHLLRLNEGRFDGAFAYEAEVLDRLPAAVPHPQVTAYGRRATGGEYLVVTRVPGRVLAEEIAAVPAGEQRALLHDLGQVVAELHATPLQPWMRSAWVADALAGRWENAYHAPPRAFPDLVAAAKVARPDATAVLEDVHAFLTERVSGASACFDEDEQEVFCHTDLHPGNVIGGAGKITGLIDFEGSRAAVPDTELDMLIRALRGMSSGGLEPAGSLLAAFVRGYPTITAHPRLVDRLLTYDALWHLVQVHHWRPGATWTQDPMVEIRAVLDGSYAAEFRALLGG
jgi:aminoglycoside phosphotransferase (APT) family kinase protein